MAKMVLDTMPAELQGGAAPEPAEEPQRPPSGAMLGCAFTI